ncbi:MAG: hypothetical protein QOI20_3439 [Acidimicrobiaceae bacterium]|nr:hypothetical protein [Acidimicrobiaceae bacterium]
MSTLFSVNDFECSMRVIRTTILQGYHQNHVRHHSCCQHETLSIEQTIVTHYLTRYVHPHALFGVLVASSVSLGGKPRALTCSNRITSGTYTQLWFFHFLPIGIKPQLCPG